MKSDADSTIIIARGQRVGSSPESSRTRTRNAAGGLPFERPGYNTPRQRESLAAFVFQLVTASLARRRSRGYGDSQRARNGLVAPRRGVRAVALVVGRVLALAAGVGALGYPGAEIKCPMSGGEPQHDHQKQLDLVCHGHKHKQVAQTHLQRVQSQHPCPLQRPDVFGAARTRLCEAAAYGYERLDSHAHQDGANAGGSELGAAVEHPGLEQKCDAAVGIVRSLEAHHPHRGGRQAGVAEVGGRVEQYGCPYGRGWRLLLGGAGEAALEAVGGVAGGRVEEVVGPQLSGLLAHAEGFRGLAAQASRDLHATHPAVHLAGAASRHLPRTSQEQDVSVSIQKNQGDGEIRSCPMNE
eukprot:scaffold247049_cov40-Prasinocladus_malaysianus.AAC.1